MNTKMNSYQKIGAIIVVVAVVMLIASYIEYQFTPALSPDDPRLRGPVVNVRVVP